ncbi:MAG: hypothetical protein GF334_10120 [Candidatus Altiarchaeales archaeon]|nr:hypothetical protein [Candidatus Altiarchaeales archaeon]
MKSEVARKKTGEKLLKTRIEAENGFIKKISFTGDFFMHPEESLNQLETQLINTEKKGVEEKIDAFFKSERIKCYGVSPQSFKEVVEEALR